MTSDELAALYDSPDSVAPHPAFDSLAEFDWSSVNDAYGPAIHVPAFLRALNSHEPPHRDFALQALMQNIWHQGTVYAATAEAIPVLVSLLTSEQTLDKQPIAFLLATLADGEPPFARCEEDQSQAERWRPILEKHGRSLEDEIRSGREFGANIRQRIADNIEVLYPFLRDSSAEVRVAVAVAVGKFPDIARGVESDLREALETEEDLSVRAEIQKVIDNAAQP